jgi:hypothetical protein
MNKGITIKVKKLNHNKKRKYTQKRKHKNKASKQLSQTQKVYTKDDYNSGDGMLTSVWGPSLWHYLHTMSFNYPVNPTEKDKKHYREFILNLRNVLPCKYCRMNLKNNLKVLPLTRTCLKNRENFSKYIYNLHELINKMLGKKSNLSYDEVRERYEHFRSRCSSGEKPKVSQLKPKKHTSKKEKGCTVPLYGKKSKCVIKIVPQDAKCETFQMDKQCMKSR